MMRRNPERVISAEWGEAGSVRQASRRRSIRPTYWSMRVDRQGLLRDITEVLSREKINVTAVNTLSRSGQARMQFTVEITGVPQLARTLKLVAGIPSVMSARRG